MPTKASHKPAGTKSKNVSTFVLDGSVTLAWFFEDEISAYAEAVENSLEHAKAVVPSLWPLEVANTLIMGERRGRTTEGKAAQFVSLLTELPITVDEQSITAHAFGPIMALARAHRLSAYDAAYLELALRWELPLATLDKKMQSAAVAAGVKIYKP